MNKNKLPEDCQSKLDGRCVLPIGTCKQCICDHPDLPREEIIMIEKIKQIIGSNSSHDLLAKNLQEEIIKWMWDAWVDGNDFGWNSEEDRGLTSNQRFQKFLVKFNLELSAK